VLEQQREVQDLDIALRRGRLGAGRPGSDDGRTRQRRADGQAGADERPPRRTLDPFQHRHLTLRAAPCHEQPAPSREVEASDLRGNEGLLHLPFTITNSGPADCGGSPLCGTERESCLGR
jgi:hypothetical protein